MARQKKLPRAYFDLKELSKEIATYNAISNVLYWDRETYMPHGGSESRSEQIALLSAHVHNLKTSKRFKQLLKRIPSETIPRPEKINVEEWEDLLERSGKLPVEFVKKFSQLTSEASQIWNVAKQSDNFDLFAPFLKRIVEMSREKAAILGFEDHPYDALLEHYEPCMTTKKISKIFENLRKELVSLLEKIRSAPQPENDFLKGPFDKQKQRELANALLASLPIDPRYSRLDLSAHPFSIAMHPHDSRITTRILNDGFLSNLFSVLHEAGHSMYEMGLPIEHWGTALAESVSLSIHESQSRWWETRIGYSLPFWRSFYPKVQQTFEAQLGGISLERFYRGAHRVEPSLIRVEADEVTYCLHIILRFELELALISGKLEVTDLPQAWREKMKELLGIEPKTDREGCLQDIHWSLGDFGYFPTYALGNLFASQFFATFSKEHRDWEERVQTGDFAFVREWLRTNIHCHGKLYDAEELAKKVTGDSFSEEAYCRYLKKKYSEIYQLS